MPRPRERWPVALSLLLVVILSSLALASPWGETARRAMRPWLPRFVVIVAVLSGIGQLATALVAGVARRGGWRVAGIPLLLGISALFMALAYVPVSSEAVPHALPIAGAALSAIGAAVLQHRARTRSES